jgi:hypothetical protein
MELIMTPEQAYDHAVAAMTDEQLERLKTAERTAELLGCQCSYWPVHDDRPAIWSVIKEGSTLIGAEFTSQSIDDVWEWLADTYDTEAS